MEKQQSQKRGIRSDAQPARAREVYLPIPPAQPVAGGFGDYKSETATDQDVALRLNEKRATQTRKENQREE